jgi:hypothetical protein
MKACLNRRTNKTLEDNLAFEMRKNSNAAGAAPSWKIDITDHKAMISC